MANTAISALPSVTTPLAGTEVLPIVQSNTTKRVTLAQIAGYATYSLPTASASVLGGIKIGSGLSIDGSGVVSAAASYTLPVATASVLGGVKQGTNTTIAADGTISVATGAGYSYTLPVATSSVLGGVKQGTNITIDANGVISASSSGASATTTISNKTAAYTVVAGDLGTIINCTSGTFTVSLTAAATLGAGFTVTVWNTSNTVTDRITIDPNSSETIDGIATLILRRGEGMQIVCDGTNWQTGNKKTMRAYAENITSAAIRPIAAADRTIAIGEDSSAVLPEGIAIGYQSRSSSNYAIAIGRATSSSVATVAIGFEAAATANSATAIGSSSSAAGAKASGQGAVALGGAYASGQDSFAAAINNNTSSYGALGANSIAIGSAAKAAFAGSVAIGTGARALANSAVAISSGYAYSSNTTASGISSISIGDSNNSAKDRSVTIGLRALADVIGKFAFSNGNITDQGDSQYGLLVLRGITTSATAAALTTNNLVAASDNQLIISNNSAYAFTGTIIARQQAAAGNDFAAWEIKGGIVRGATASTTALGTYNINVLSKSAGAVTWTIALSADTANGGLAITVTGAAATNIRWVATVQTSEVTYA
jgi:hypothetical protein